MEFRPLHDRVRRDKEFNMTALLISTEAMVAELPQKQSMAMPGGAGGGTGGMGGGMDF
jgi:hypothetical protein